MTSNRRRYRRLPLEATVGFQELSFHADSEPAVSSYKDVSGGGVLLESAREIPLGTLLKLEISVPGWGRFQNTFGPVQDADQRPLVALGEVVRVERMEDGRFELGVKFQNVYPDDLAALTKYVEAHAPVDEN